MIPASLQVAEEQTRAVRTVGAAVVAAHVRTCRLTSERVDALAQTSRYSMLRAGTFAALFAVWSVVFSTTQALSEVRFHDPRAALQQGIAALRSGNLEIAIPALEFAAKRDVFPAHYYLARVYADNNSPLTDHGKAFELLYRFIKLHGQTDSADYRRAPMVSRAMTRLARYLLQGVPQINLPADHARAVRFLELAATEFNDDDAQFELAKLRLTGDGIRRNARVALHWLSVLSQKGHPGAQAFLADLNWRGKYTTRNPIRALVLITLALENAPQEDRIWIEDIHQNIVCGAKQGNKHAASGMVANWRRKYARSTRSDAGDLFLSLNVGPQRTCADGTPVQRLAPMDVADDKGVADNKTTPPPGRPGADIKFNYGNTGDALHPGGRRKRLRR